MPPTKTNGVFASATRQLKLNNCKVEFALMLALRTGEAMLFAKKLYIAREPGGPGCSAADYGTTDHGTTDYGTKKKKGETLKTELLKSACAGLRREKLAAALQEGGGVADSGEWARDNVRKALALVLGQLREGGPEENAFAEHLRTHLSLGHECLYSQPQGRIWT